MGRDQSLETVFPTCPAGMSTFDRFPTGTAPMKKSSLRLTCAPVLWLALAFHATAHESMSPVVGPDERRAAMGAEQIKARAKARRELGDTEFYLGSIQPPVSLAELTPVIRSSGIRVSALHSCARGGGVTSFQIYSDDISSSLAAPMNQPIQSSHMIMLPGFCGVEFKSTLAELQKFQAEFGDRLRALEVTSIRVRMLAMPIAP
jgi:hypothetical protein